MKYRNDSAKLLISELGTKAVMAVNESGITAAHVASSAGQFCDYIDSTSLRFYNSLGFKLMCAACGIPECVILCSRCMYT